MEATLSSKNQVTIPKQVRDYLHLRPGDRFKFFFQPDGAVVLLPRIPAKKLKGSLSRPGQSITVKEMNAAVQAGAAHSSSR